MVITFASLSLLCTSVIRVAQENFHTLSLKPFAKAPYHSLSFSCSKTRFLNPTFESTICSVMATSVLLRSLKHQKLRTSSLAACRSVSSLPLFFFFPLLSLLQKGNPLFFFSFFSWENEEN